MANIPSIRRSLAPFSNIRKRGQIHFPQIDETDNNKQRITFTERRFNNDRRKKNIKILFDRRQINNRRNKIRLNKSNTSTHREPTGQMIDTTA